MCGCNNKKTDLTNKTSHHGGTPCASCAAKSSFDRARASTVEQRRVAALIRELQSTPSTTARDMRGTYLGSIAGLPLDRERPNGPPMGNNNSNNNGSDGDKNMNNRNGGGGNGSSCGVGVDLMTGRAASEIAFNMNGCMRSDGSGGLGYEQDPKGDDWHATERQTIPSIIVTPESCGLTVTAPDYPCLGPISQLRASNRLMHALGFYEASAQQLAQTSGQLWGLNVASIAAWKGNYILGVVIDWSIKLTSFTTFEATLRTTGFTNSSGASLDRDLTVRFDAPNTAGRIYLPLAYRAAKGMLLAAPQIHQIPPATVSPPATKVEIDGVPVGIASDFSAQVRILSAFTVATAEFNRLAGSYVA